jgi:hypothetical protein
MLQNSSLPQHIYWYFYRNKLHSNVYRPESGHLQGIAVHKNKLQLPINLRAYIEMACILPHTCRNMLSCNVILKTRQ